MTEPKFSNIDVPSKQFAALTAELKTMYRDMFDEADQPAQDQQTICLLIARDGRSTQSDLSVATSFADKVNAAVKDLPADGRVIVFECVDVARRMIEPAVEKLHHTCEAIIGSVGDQVDFASLSIRYTWDNSNLFGSGAVADFALMPAADVFSEEEKLEILTSGIGEDDGALSPLALLGQSDEGDAILGDIIKGIAPELEVAPDQIDEVVALLPDGLLPAEPA